MLYVLAMRGTALCPPFHSIQLSPTQSALKLCAINSWKILLMQTNKQNLIILEVYNLLGAHSCSGLHVVYGPRVGYTQSPIKVLENTGTKMDLWGIPLITDPHQDIEPLTTTLQPWLSNQFPTRWIAYSSNPYLSHLRDKDVVNDHVKGL